MKSEHTQMLLQDESLISYYARVRQDSELICKPLEIEDFGIQTMPEVSPPKWHLAHTSWFFETLLLKPFLPGYQQYNPQFAVLFNSYYDTIGTYHPRPQRGLLSRPTVDEVYRYRAYVDDAMTELISGSNHPDAEAIESLTILGLNHEQQHQELLLTDIKHIFASNPLKPVYKHLDTLLARPTNPGDSSVPDIDWIHFDGGIKSVGHAGQGFAYDNEGPQHKVYLENYELAAKPVSNAEYLEFMQAGGYADASYWLSDAWALLKQQHWQAPLYWEQKGNEWFNMTLSGLQPVDMAAPVCHVSYFEAAAYTRWVSEKDPSVRLPTEAEWEIAARKIPLQGQLRDLNCLQPHALPANESQTGLKQMFGDVWEWTQSPYTAYPGYHAASGPMGEYNGKFMSSQMVLRGGSCVTPADHIRATYRNFFYPHERWQFSGFRLARDAT